MNKYVVFIEDFMYDDGSVLWYKGLTYQVLGENENFYVIQQDRFNPKHGIDKKLENIKYDVLECD